MKAILLAAGEGKRMRPLTLETPKPMIEILGKPLLHHIIDSLPAEITELIIVIGYKGDQIKKYFGERFQGRKITYVFQQEPKGTGHALELCRPYITPGEKFLFMIGDDLHSPKALKNLLKHEFAMLVHEHADPSRFGVVEVDKHNIVVGFEEKPLKPKSNLVSPAVFVMDDRIFTYPKVLHRTGEFFAVDQINQMMRDVPLIAERSDFWFPIGFPHDIDKAEELLLKDQKLPQAWHNTKVVLVAGGHGTRLPKEEQNKPKCLVELGGKPILQHQLENLRAQGLKNICLALGYKANLVIDWLKKSGNTDVSYVIEPESLDTGGGFKLAVGNSNEPFFGMNCDDISDVSFAGLARHSCGGRYNVISAMQFDDSRTFGFIKHDEFKRITSFEEKSPQLRSGLVSIGRYYLLPGVFDDMPDKFSIEKDLFPKLASQGKLVMHTHTGYWLTVNSAEQLASAREYFSKSH